MQDFEKLGTFYAGKRFDYESDTVTEDLILYDSKDLTTHALVVGMTGSGKTGLSLSLLEEAAIDGIPAIAIDPKGDLSNLFLSFPDLNPEDFEPWVDPAEATRKGMNIKEYAKKTAAMWENGINSWGQDKQRIKKFKDSCELNVYTPGSNAGRPLSVLQSFNAPSSKIIEDPDAMREQVSGVVSGLLALIDVDADPILSREHILISRLINTAWKNGKDYQISSLISQIQKPPFNKLGILSLESFFPAKDRIELSMKINGLLASSGFEAWMQGEPLDINSLLYAKDGSPKLSILSIAHLSEKERMFFVSLFLNKMVSWVRAQPGTSSLRAILYMDEIAGYFPPIANPPSKPPMLTLLKQARAHGLGVMLATQNPVDLDYKGLSNIGTWFLGRLQTEQDKNRILDGLESASDSGMDRNEMNKMLSGLKSRVFLMNNVHDKHPVIFHTRWVLSYLRGPLTRVQINNLAKSQRPPEDKLEKISKAKQKSHQKPVLPPEIEEIFIDTLEVADTDENILFRPALISTMQLHYSSAKANLDVWTTVTQLKSIHGGISNNTWEDSLISYDIPDYSDELDINSARFAELPSEAMQVKNYKSWHKKLKSYAYKEHTLTIFHCPSLKLFSQIDSSLEEFQAELRLAIREKRDLNIEKLKTKFAPKLETIQDKIQASEHKLEREQQEKSSGTMKVVIAIGSTLLGALFGRKLTSSRNIRSAASVINRSLRTSKDRGDVRRAEEKLAEQLDDLEILEQKFKEEIKKLESTMTLDNLDIKEIKIHPKKSDLEISNIRLAWTPWLIDKNGLAQKLFQLNLSNTNS